MELRDWLMAIAETDPKLTDAALAEQGVPSMITGCSLPRWEALLCSALGLMAVVPGCKQGTPQSDR